MFAVMAVTHQTQIEVISNDHNHINSPGLWNMYLTTALALCDRMGTPVSTALFTTTRSGSQLCR